MSSKKKARRKARKQAKKVGRRIVAMPATKSAGVSFAGKVASPVPVVTSGGMVYTRQCWSGHPPGRKGAKFCTTCGEPFTATLGQHVDMAVKSASTPRSPWAQAWLAETNPQHSESLWYLMHPEITNPRGGRSA